MTHEKAGIRPTTDISSGAGSEESRVSVEVSMNSEKHILVAADAQEASESSEESDSIYSGTDPERNAAKKRNPASDDDWADALFRDEKEHANVDEKEPVDMNMNADDDDGEGSIDEAEIPVKRPKNPADPKPEEKERHYSKGHLPYRGWCKVCVEARGREDAHYQQTMEELKSGLPKVAIDYASVGDGKDKKTELKLLVGRDRWTKHTFCHLCKCKGLGDPLIVQKTLRSIKNTGNADMILKTDGEPALVQVQEKIMEERKHKTVPENPPAHDPQANGEAERAVQEVKAELRALKLGLEQRLQQEIPAGAVILEWMIPHGADCVNRFLPGRDGRTAYYRVRGKNFDGAVYEIGEQVLAKPKRGKKTSRKTPLEPRFREATWVGFVDRSKEHMVVMKDGGPAIRVRTVRPRPEGERWNHEAVLAIRATPDVPNPADHAQRDVRAERETKGLDFGARGGQDLPEAPVNREPGLVRDFRINDELLEKYGFTDGCPGCEAKIDGTARRLHSTACRQRIEDAIRSDEPEIITRRDERRKRDDRLKPKDDQEPNASARAAEPAPKRPRAGNEGAHTEASEGEPKAAGLDHSAAPEAADGLPEQPKASGPAEDDAESEDEGNKQPTPKRQKMDLLEHESRRDRIERSLKNIMEGMIRSDTPMISVLCNHEIFKEMLDELDKTCTRKLQRQLRRKVAAQKTAVDVAEAYSPPRLTDMAEKLGYKKGFALDLTEKDEGGRAWDLSVKEIQDDAIRRLDEEAPWLLMVSPPCTMFSTLQGFSIPRQEQDVVQTKLEDAIKHIAFAVLLCLRQARAGRKFALEHPVGASSWHTALVNKLYFVEDGGRVNFDFCMAGMQLDGVPAKKRTGVVTNSVALQDALKEMQCSGEHEHADLTGGKARACQVYPEKFCKLVCETVMKERNQANGIIALLTKVDPDFEAAEATDITEEINSMLKHPHDEDPHVTLYQEFDFVDDVSGKPLNHSLATEARRLEIEFFRKMQVYEKVPRWRAAQEGCKVITTRWIDVNKGDSQRPNYRARLVGRELKLDNRLDLFAATPPLESLRLMCSLCASNQNRQRPFRMLSIDVKRAYFYAKAQRPVYIEIPIEDYEDGDEKMVGKLNLSLYGTRDAAQNWAREYTDTLQKCGFEQGKATPCSFVHEDREIFITVHGDDFTAAGPLDSLQWLEEQMERRYEIKSEYLGPEANLSREIRVLNRVIRWTPRGLEYEPDQRHAEIIIADMQMKGARPVMTPAVVEDKDAQELREASKELNKTDARQYRALAARLNYLAMDRLDLQFTAKCISKHMATPREHDWGALKRVARYLVGATRSIQRFEWQDMPLTVTTFTDSDWAGDRKSRRSTSGGVMMLGKHVIKSWSSTQQVIALSSGEAELYAILKGASQTKGLMSMLLDYSYELTGTVKTDASAAIGMAHRQGLGRTRHIDVQYLWIQSEVADNTLKIDKVRTDDNVADLLTKSLKPEIMKRHLDFANIILDTSRAATAPRLQFLDNNDHWEATRPEYWARRHVKPRRSLFTPMRVPGGPRNSEAIGSVRVTIGKFDDGEPFMIEDDWKGSPELHHRLEREWTGVTAFTHEAHKD